jgi:NAD(P)-dependent dehydrogenase (short-subunit alcohol dehydrogenase family)
MTPAHTTLVTGATSGLGRYLAERLGERGHTVLAHGRDRAKLDELTRRIPGSLGYLADLSSLDDVRSLADRVGDDHPKLDVLINNAGVGFGGPGSGRELSADGHELRFAVNYLAPYLLTRRLLPTLRAAAPSQVLNVGSAGQQPIDFGDPEMERSYQGVTAYCRSKLALAMFTFDLAAELTDDQVRVNVLHPATYMDTTMVVEGGITPINTVPHGGDATLRVLEQAETTGQYFDEDRPADAHADAYDPALRARLRELTRSVVGE